MVCDISKKLIEGQESPLMSVSSSGWTTSAARLIILSLRSTTVHCSTFVSLSSVCQIVTFFIFFCWNTLFVCANSFSFTSPSYASVHHNCVSWWKTLVTAYTHNVTWFGGRRGAKRRRIINHSHWDSPQRGWGRRGRSQAEQEREKSPAENVGDIRHKAIW